MQIKLKRLEALQVTRVKPTLSSLATLKYCSDIGMANVSLARAF